jgi:hypothetical protein
VPYTHAQQQSATIHLCSVHKPTVMTKLQSAVAVPHVLLWGHQHCADINSRWKSSMTLCKVGQNDTGTDPPQQQTAIHNQRKAHFLQNWYNNNPSTPYVDSLELSTHQAVTNPSQLRTQMHVQRSDTYRSDSHSKPPAPYSLESFPRGKTAVARGYSHLLPC